MNLYKNIQLFILLLIISIPGYSVKLRCDQYLFKEGPGGKGRLFSVKFEPKSYFVDPNNFIISKGEPYAGYKTTQHQYEYVGCRNEACFNNYVNKGKDIPECDIEKASSSEFTLSILTGRKQTKPVSTKIVNYIAPYGAVDVNQNDGKIPSKLNYGMKGTMYVNGNEIGEFVISRSKSNNLIGSTEAKGYDVHYVEDDGKYDFHMIVVEKDGVNYGFSTDNDNVYITVDPKNI